MISGFKDFEVSSSDEKHKLNWMSVKPEEPVGDGQYDPCIQYQLFPIEGRWGSGMGIDWLTLTWPDLTYLTWPDLISQQYWTFTILERCFFDNQNENSVTEYNTKWAALSEFVSSSIPHDKF